MPINDSKSQVLNKLENAKECLTNFKDECPLGNRKDLLNLKKINKAYKLVDEAWDLIISIPDHNP